MAKKDKYLDTFSTEDAQKAVNNFLLIDSKLELIQEKACMLPDYQRKELHYEANSIKERIEALKKLIGYA